MSETQTFTAIPTRVNGPTQGPVTASFFNLIRLAGKRLEEIFGAGVYPQTQQSITDGMSATNLTGASFAPASYTAFHLQAKSYRDDGTNQRSHLINVYGEYNSKRATWDLTVEEFGRQSTSGADTSAVSGITFSMSGNQVQVATDTMGGSHVGKLNWKVVSTFTVES